ncbi:MAG TPA: tyrosine-type recombinase/integrase [Solirubrobacteraceae bacterium]|nr:tyrosine-type recombinase/integrase [Solirubrobacteraceae bacterium]
MRDPLGVGVTGPLARYAPGFVGELVEVGYRPSAAAVQLRLLAHLSRWLEREGIDPGDVGEPEIERFRKEDLARVRSLRIAGGLVPLLAYLRGLGVVPVAGEPVLSNAELLLARYREYLLVERGVTAGTARGYIDCVRPFVLSRAREDGKLDLAGLTPQEVLGFVLADCRRRPRRSAKLMVTALRSLLRFLHVEGVIDRPLAQVVPSVAFWRLQGLPRGLDFDQVRALLESCDTGTANGRRDLAIVLLLVRLGMRRGEVARLRLEDIEWRAGELLVRGKGPRVERLPLPADVGEALAAYLRDGRPADAGTRAVFMRVRAPRAAMTPPGITQVVVSASKRAGLGEVTPHRLRHTAASELLRRGAPLSEIGQLLRHRTELTTTIYAKVDRDRLRELALPWPGGAA